MSQQYEAIAQEEGRCDGTLPTHTPRVYPYGFTLTAHDKYDVLLNRAPPLPIEAKSILEHVESVLWSAPTPEFYLTIDVYSDAAPTQDKLPALSIPIALPQPAEELRTIYCRADDVPCLRGGYTSSEFGGHKNTRAIHRHLHRRLKDRTIGDLGQPWSLAATGKLLAVVAKRHRDDPTGRIMTADEGSVQRWNVRNQRNLLCPWQPLADSDVSNERALEPQDVQPSHLAPWPSRSNRRKGVKAVQMFLDDTRAWSKYLVFPQSCYGWDLQMLESIITTDLARSRRELNTSGILSFLSPQYQSVKISIQPKAPVTPIRYFPDARLEKAHLAVPALRNPLITLLPLCLLPWTTAFCIVFPSPFTVFISVVAAAGLVSLFALNIVLMDDYGTIHEAIGLAFAMKRWIAVSADAHASREDVVSSIRGATDAKQVGNVWYALIGTDEAQWWGKVRSAVFDAIRKGEESPIIIEEMYAGPPRRAEQDDAPSGTDLHVLPPSYTEQATGISGPSVYAEGAFSTQPTPSKP